MSNKPIYALREDGQSLYSYTPNIKKEECAECKKKTERYQELEKVVQNITTALDRAEKLKHTIPDSIMETAKDVLNNMTRSHVKAAKKMAEYIIGLNKK